MVWVTHRYTSIVCHLRCNHVCHNRCFLLAVCHVRGTNDVLPSQALGTDGALLLQILGSDCATLQESAFLQADQMIKTLVL